MIYIIDDDQNIRNGFMILLKSAGYGSVCFESAEAFLENYKQGVNDLLILDISLTGMNGFDLLDNMEEKGLHLAVIVVSAFANPKNRDRCREYGIKAYLQKPVDGEALISLIRYSISNDHTGQ